MWYGLERVPDRLQCWLILILAIGRLRGLLTGKVNGLTRLRKTKIAVATFSLLETLPYLIINSLRSTIDRDLQQLTSEFFPSADSLISSSLHLISQLVVTHQCRPAFVRRKPPTQPAQRTTNLLENPSTLLLLAATARKSFNMCSRPTNIGIKAIEIYFPSQVRQNFRDAEY